MIPRTKISNAILDAVEMTDDYYVNRRPWLFKLAERAFNNIKSPYQYIPTIHVVDVVDGRTLTVPTAVYSILEFIPGDYGTDCWNMFKCLKNGVDLPYIESQEQWISNGTLPFLYNGSKYGYKVVGNQMIFDTIMPFESITMLTNDNVRDDSGEIMIPEDCLEVISKFLQVQIAEVELRQAIRRKEYNYVATNNLKFMKDEYHKLVLRTRGRLANYQTEENNEFMKYFSR